MKMKNLPISVRIYEKEYVDTAKIELDGESEYEHIKSFDIKKNFERIIIASKKISSKPSRISIKFETFDHRFQIQYMDKAIFQDAISLIRSFYTYRKQILENHKDV